MNRNGERTRNRILDAATSEFAAFGIAGARIDRIASAAHCNKSQIYQYFNGKDVLFDAVMNRMVLETVKEIPFDATDLAGYAGRMYDGYERHPEVARLVTWYRLERSDTHPPFESITTSRLEKVAAIEQAQVAGRVTSHFAPVDVLAVVLALAAMWNAVTPEFAVLGASEAREHRRQVVVDAVVAALSTGCRAAPALTAEPHRVAADPH